MASRKKVEVEITANDETKGPLGAAKTHISEWAGDIRTKFVEAFAFEKVLEKSLDYVKEFFTEAIQQADAAEASMQGLRTQLANAGIVSGEAATKVNELADALQETTRFDDDAIRDAFTDLLGITNNYAASLQNIGLVADVAVARQIDLRTAADLVGRVMMGQMQMLTRYGIVVEKGANAMDVLRQRFGGFAEQDGKTFQGRLAQLQHGFEDVLKQIGFAITGTSDLGSSVKVLTGWLSQAAAWLQAHREALHQWVAGLLEGIKLVALTGKNITVFQLDFAKSIVESIRMLIDKAIASVLELLDTVPHAINDLIDAANHLPGVHIAVRMPTLDGMVANFRQKGHEAGQAAVDGLKGMWGSIVGEVGAISGAINSVRGEHGVAPGAGAGHGGGGGGGGGGTALTKAEEDWLKQIAKEDAEDAAKQFAAIQKARGALGAISPIGSAGLRRTNPIDLTSTIAAFGDITAADAPDLHANPFAGALATGIDEVKAKLEDATAASLTFGQSIMDLGTAPIQSFAAAASQAFEAWATKSGSAGKAFEGAIAGSIRNVALKKAQFYTAEALGAMGEALLTGNAAAFAAAAEDSAAAAGFFALAGGAASFGAGGASRSGGGAGALSASNPAASVQGSQGPVTVVLKGRKLVLDSRDPDDRAAIRDMITELVGDREIAFLVEDT